MAKRVNILAFDTSSVACSVALQHGDQVKCLHQIAPMQHAKLILPMIQNLLQESSLTLHQLDAIAYGCGPGSFTGIRIASSVVQGLGFASHRPIIQISSLAALAQATWLAKAWAKVLVALDARMDKLYWGMYEQEEGLMKLSREERLCSLSEIRAPEGENWYGVGDAWEKYADKLQQALMFQPLAMDSSLLPTAEAILRLAAIKLNKRDFIQVSEAIPVYLR